MVVLKNTISCCSCHQNEGLLDYDTLIGDVEAFTLLKRTEKKESDVKKRREAIIACVNIS